MGKGLFGRVQSELKAREKTPGLSMADILELPESLRHLVNWLMRQDQVELRQISEYLGQNEKVARDMLTVLLDKGFVREIDIKGCVYYRIRLAPKKKKDMPSSVWGALDEKMEKEG